MAKLLCGPSNLGTSEGKYKAFVENSEEGAGRWFFTKKEIEENSPSRRDGVDLKKETYLRKSYCTFLQDLGMRLKVICRPQLTIATAIIFCHRFYLRQSHAKNDRRIIATVCMFLAGKVEETPRALKDVIIVSYQIIHKRDKEAVQRIKHKEVYEQQKELILLGERVVLVTLGFDFNIDHPYKLLILALKKFDVEKALVRVAWNFLNDGLRTSISLQYKAPQIAAGAIFLAAKFLKVELPFDIEKVLVQEFDITKRQLADINNQILELYEQSKMPPSQPSEISSITEYKGDNKTNDIRHHEGVPMPCQAYPGETSARAETTNIDTPQISQPGEISSIEACGGDSWNDIRHHDQESMPSRANSGETSARAELTNTAAMDKSGRNLLKNEPPQVASKKLNTEKLRAAFEQRKASGVLTHKMEDSMDELERELENVEVPTGNKKIKRETQSGLRPAEKGEVEVPSDANREFYRSPSPGTRKRKASSPLQ